MGAGYSGFEAKASTPEMAVQRLIAKLNGKYRLERSQDIQIVETSPGFYETNIVTKDEHGNIRRVEVNQLWDAARNTHYYRAWFGLAA
jgi:xanthine dehydrogenase molybdopterin-binding subunit B